MVLDSSQKNRVYYSWRWGWIFSVEQGLLWGWIFLSRTGFTKLGSVDGFFSVEQVLLYLEVGLDSSQLNMLYYTWKWGWILFSRTGFTILGGGDGFFSVENGLLYYTWKWGLILLCRTGFATLGSEAVFFSVEQGLQYLEVGMDSSQ